MKKIMKNILLAILSSTLMVLAHPPVGLFPLMFIAYIPLLCITLNDKLINSFIYPLISGFVFYIFSIFWLKIFHPLALPMLSLFIAIYYTIPFIITRFLKSYLKIPIILSFPILSVLIEYIRSIGFLGFPWNYPVHSQYIFLPLIQIAEITGIWGISFIIFTINITIYISINDVISKRKFIIKPELIYAISILIITIIFGITKLKEPKPGKSIKIGLIQMNIDPNAEWHAIKNSALGRLTWLSQKARLDGADLIIWPESSVIEYIYQYLKLDKNIISPPYKNVINFCETVVRTAKDLECYILFGALDYIMEKSDYGKFMDYYNTAFLISRKGKIIEWYYKNHLVPFGEYFPFKIKYVQNILREAEVSGFTPSIRKTIFSTHHNDIELKSACLICYEGIFGNLCRRFVKNGAEILINITNDSWAYSRNAQFQHAINNIFRAIENRVPYLRAANTGLTCIIDTRGRIIKKLPYNKSAHLTANIHIPKCKQTIYTKFGDWFIIIIFLILISLISGYSIHKIFSK